MSHTPYIVASYAISAVVMLWCALAPLLKKRAALANIRRLNRLQEHKSDPNA